MVGSTSVISQLPSALCLDIEYLSSQIPKPNKFEGLGIEWPSAAADKEKLKALCEDIKSRM